MCNPFHMKGIILDGYALNPGDLSFDCLKAIADFEVYGFTSPDLVIERCCDKEIVITNKVVFSKDVIQQLPHLRYIGVSATGYNIIDIDECRKRGIAVTNIPAYSTDAVAQHVFAFILSIANRVDEHDRSVKRGDWEKSPCFCYWLSPLFELKGKTIGIIGLGNIGKQVARLALAFGMNVLAYSPHSKMEGVMNLPLADVISSSDIITLHCPQNENTAGMMNKDFLSHVRKGAILINASRGGLVCEGDVIEALNDGTLSWYCADVLEKEPPVNNMLSRHERSIVTPHIAWAPVETRQRLLSILAENLSSFIRNERLNRIV